MVAVANETASKVEAGSMGFGESQTPRTEVVEFFATIGSVAVVATDIMLEMTKAAFDPHVPKGALAIAGLFAFGDSVRRANRRSG